MFDATTRLQGSYAQIQRMALQPETAIKLYQEYFIVSVTSKIRFTNNRLTRLRVDKTLLGSSGLCRIQL